MSAALETKRGARTPMVRADAIWRSPADSYWEACGEPCEILGTERDGLGYRILFADGEEMSVPADELDFTGDARSHPSVGACQASLDVGEV